VDLEGGEVKEVLVEVEGVDQPRIVTMSLQLISPREDSLPLARRE
jgi:hypothetical protein